MIQDRDADMRKIVGICTTRVSYAIEPVVAFKFIDFHTLAVVGRRRHTGHSRVAVQRLCLAREQSGLPKMRANRASLREEWDRAGQCSRLVWRPES